MRCASFWRRSTFHLPKGGTLRPDGFNRILARVKGRDVERLVNEVVLRTPGAGGIFGREFRPFRPQSAPLRAFHLADPPLCRSHRASRLDPRGQARLRRACRRHAMRASLAEIAANISATERRAMKAERETADRLIAHFLADRVGATFDGHISGVTRAGLFVELDETGADGFIPARTIGDEYFRFHEAGRAFVGRSRHPSARRSGDGRACRSRARRRRLAFQACAAMIGAAAKRAGQPPQQRRKFAQRPKSRGPTALAKRRLLHE